MNQQMMTSPKQEVDRGRNGGEMRPAIVYRPDSDIYETEDHVVIVADMPGVSPDGMDVTIEHRVLTIRGRVAGHSHSGYRQVYAEYGVGDFERVFTISEDIDREHIRASMKDGVLMLELPKAASAKTKKIEVKAA